MHELDKIADCEHVVEDFHPVKGVDFQGATPSRFMWKIERFSGLKQKLYSERLLVFPEGNNVEYLSLYIVADSPDLSFGRNVNAQFSLAVVNQMNESLTVRKETRHQFNHSKSDWGFEFFMPLDDLCDPSKGYLVNDTIVIEAAVTLCRIVDDGLMKKSGFVGLENLGATCSLNSLSQTLYHIPYFRKAVYQIPTEENDIPSQSVALALQRLFFKLQHSDRSVATKDLTKSLGWDRDDYVKVEHLEEYHADHYDFQQQEYYTMHEQDKIADCEHIFKDFHPAEGLDFNAATPSQIMWRIKRFAQLKQKLYSEFFSVGSYKWRVLVFPEGNNVEYLSLYIVADSPDLSFGRNVNALFSLAVLNQMDETLTVRKETRHWFNHSESDWGFEFFIPLDELRDPSKGYLVNDEIVIEATLTVCRIVDDGLMKKSGFVGLENLGATCSLNSLLQTLYHIPYFRKAVYQIPTEENDIPSQSVALALQRLFFKLQHSDRSVATEDLTKSLGWDRDDYIKVEHLEEYHADHYDFQRAKKFVQFIDFPPVPRLQLNLFESRLISEEMVKESSLSATSLLAWNAGNFVMLAADSRTTIPYTGEVVSNNYEKIKWIYGGMYIEISGCIETAETIIAYLQTFLPTLYFDIDRKFRTVEIVQSYSQYAVRSTRDLLYSVQFIVGGYWSDPTILDLFYIPHSGPSVSSRLCTGGSGSRFMYPWADQLYYVPPQEIMVTMVNIMHHAILWDTPFSGSYICFLVICSDGTRYSCKWEPDNIDYPLRYRLIPSIQAYPPPQPPLPPEPYPLPPPPPSEPYPLPQPPLPSEPYPLPPPPPSDPYPLPQPPLPSEPYPLPPPPPSEPYPLPQPPPP